MRRAVPGLLISVLLAACGGVWTPEQQLTKQLLVNAQMVRGAVSYQAQRYEEVLRAAATAADPGKQASANLQAYYQSGEGRVVYDLLNGVLNPPPADASFPRAKDIDELAGATAALAVVALRPEGEWADWMGKVNAARSRLDAAIAALEKGTKGYVLIDVRQVSNIKTAEFTASLAKARAEDEAKAKGAAPATTP